MASIRVLITTSYYWPEGAGSAPYLAGLAEHLSECGHDVVVATTFPHYPEWKSSAQGRLGTTESRAGVTIRRRWHYVPAHQSAVQRALYEASLYASGVTALGMRRRPDVVIGTCPSLSGGLLAVTAAELYRRPYGLVFQDLMGPAALQSGVTGGDRVSHFVRRAELALARRAAAIAVIAEGFRSYFEEGGVPAGRIVRLRNWARRVEPGETRSETRARFRWGPDEFVCLHGGNMGLKQGLDNLLNAAELLREEPVRIVLAGDGSDRKRLQQRANALRLENLSFVEMQGPGRFEEIMQASDLLLVIQRPSVTDMSLPSKLTSYFAAGKPVLAAASIDSETAQEIEAAGAGCVVPPDDAQALRNGILAIKAFPDRAALFGMSGERYARSELSRSKILADYERFVDRLIASSGPG